MGQAKLRRQQSLASFERVKPAAERVATALRKLATAASSNLGSDCYMHAHIAQVLLQDLGIKTRAVAGHAAWRIGSGDEDVLAHVSGVKGYLPEGAEGFAYHVWLETIEEGGGSPILIDVTAYQFQRKARELDAADGGRTQVEWTPELLVLRREDLRTYQEVAKAPGPGLAYYEEVGGMLQRLNSAGYELDPEDVEAARLILRSPNIQVFGPNDQADQEGDREIRYRPV